MFKDVCEKMIDSFSDDVPRVKKEYLDEEGFLRCAICHERVEYLASVPELGIERKVRCICSCIVKERDAHKEQERQQEIARMRSACFEESKMHTWTFENDDRRNAKLSDAMMRYADMFEIFKKDSKGLMLYGPVGTGKSYYAACIANRLMDNAVPCFMTNFSKITNKLQGMFEGKQEYINSLNKYPLLILDDLGIERKTEYMAEMVYNIVDSRYRSGLPFIITTNLSADEIKKPQEVAYSRIYDRILERCHPVKVDGGSRRRESLKASYSETNELLGL